MKANTAYLQKLVEGLQGHSINTMDYKLTRKEIYVQSANLSAAIQRMLSEPKNKQKHIKDIEQFTLLNHILFSNIATLISSIIYQAGKQYSPETVQLATKALTRLQEIVQKLDEGYAISLSGVDYQITSEPVVDLHFNDQLEYIHQTIKKIKQQTNSKKKKTNLFYRYSF